MKTNKNEETLILIVVVVALIFLFKGIKGFLEALNIIPDETEKKAASTVAATVQSGTVAPSIPTPEGFEEYNISGDPFNPNYYKNISKAAQNEAAKKGKKSGTMLIKQENANIRAKNIYESVGFLYDKTGEAVAQFKKCKYKTQVSQVCAAFNNEYYQDCLSWMRNKFDRQDQIQDLAEIVDYVNNLPSGAYIFPKNRTINEILTK